MAAVASSDTASAAEQVEEVHVSRRGVIPKAFPAFPGPPPQPAAFQSAQLTAPRLPSPRARHLRKVVSNAVPADPGTHSV